LPSRHSPEAEEIIWLKMTWQELQKCNQRDAAKRVHPIFFRCSRIVAEGILNGHERQRASEEMESKICFEYQGFSWISRPEAISCFVAVMRPRVRSPSVASHVSCYRPCLPASPLILLHESRRGTILLNTRASGDESFASIEK